MDKLETLKGLYASALSALSDISASQDGISGPLFLSVPKDYERTAVRLMIVGQQTYGWPSITIGLDGLLSQYREFDLGRGYTASPFWQASHRLFAALNPAGPERAFLWSDLVKVDQHNERPAPDVEEQVSKLGLLLAELRLLKPDVVVFFTGPHYDDRLKKTFPGVEYRELTPDVAMLKHADLPVKAYRTYHPRYLWQAKKRAALDAIVENAGDA